MKDHAITHTALHVEMDWKIYAAVLCGKVWERVSHMDALRMNNMNIKVSVILF